MDASAAHRMHRTRRPAPGWSALGVTLALAGCGGPGPDGSGEQPDDGGMTLEEHCAGLVAYDVEAARTDDGVEVSWGYAAPTRDVVPFTVLRRAAGSTADAWTTVATVGLRSADGYRYVDTSPDALQASGGVEYAVAPTEPGCERSDVCPEVADACATATPVATEPD